MNKETILQNKIRAECSDIAVLFRINVGVFSTADGRTISTGVPAGFPDLFGFRRSDGKAVFIEVKTATGRPTKKQTDFINALARSGAISGIARSVEEARGIIKCENLTNQKI